jgi:hypothetical protein
VYTIGVDYEGKRLPIHITQAFQLSQTDEQLDFFDANLKYDSALFIDPFLLKRSSVPEERRLFERFGDFFRFAYDESLNILTDKREYDSLLELLDFEEPREICLGYTELSSDGHSPGKSFGGILIKFFLKTTARQLIKENALYPDKRFNPKVLEIFTKKLGPDGLSDISANLIMDYLISYTQHQCKALGIPTKMLAVNADGFDFDPNEMEWRGGGHYDLPENPFYPGRSIVFVPKRLLRAIENDDNLIVQKVVGILSADPKLQRKFTKLLEKELSAFNGDDARKVLLEDHAILKRYMTSLEAIEREPYNFERDPLAFLAYRKYESVFSALRASRSLANDEKVFEITNKFIEIMSTHLSRTDAWRDLWQWRGAALARPATEKVFQRIVAAMGKMYFFHYPDITFEPEVGTGNGSVDFKVIYKSCRIAIELKRLLSSDYMNGIKLQLPDYAELAATRYAIYITAQHYTRAYPRSTKKSDDARVLELEQAVPNIEKTIKDSYPSFKQLAYINIDVSPKPSASRLVI